MFYFKSILWFLISLVARILFYSRLHFCRRFNYPILPVEFYFEKFSVYWLYFLAFFYQEDNYLAQLPVSKHDALKIKHFRKFVKSYPLEIINFYKFYFLKGGVFFGNFNSYKDEFRLFKTWVDMSRIFNVFFNKSDNFLKFLFFREYTIKNSFIHFFISEFYDLIQDNPDCVDFFYKDFILTCNLMFFKKKNYFNYVNHYDCINLLVIHKLLNKNKKLLSVNNNLHFEMHQKYLKFFKKLRKDKIVKFYTMYDALWSTSYLNLYNLYVVLNYRFGELEPFKKINFFKNYPVKIIETYSRFMNSYWPVKNQSGFFSKFVDLNCNKHSTIFFLRKTKIFNKGRYSRNRQLYRTGVYMCLWINIIFVYFYIFAFYRFTFNFGFVWLGIGVFILSMTFSRAAKYRFYNLKNFIIEFYDFILWGAYFLEDSLKQFKKFFYHWLFFFKNWNKLGIFFLKE